MVARLAAVAALAALGMRAYGQPLGPGEGPCDRDASALCPNRYNGPLAACLIAQRRHLSSPACAAEMRDLEPCAAELAALCPDAVPGGGRLIDCLRQRRRDVSPSCLKALSTLPGQEETH